jgi:CheY-like chemotaxis protein
MTNFQFLLIGDFCDVDFASVRGPLAAFGRTTECANVATAIEQIKDAGGPPDVIILAQSRPGEFCNKELDALQRQAPLAPILGLLGTWCEGEMRTGKPWPGMIRTYWHAWLPRWLRQFQRLSSGQLPVWGLPVTSTDDERVMFAHDAKNIAAGQLVAVRSYSYDMADMLCDVCARRGYATIWIDPRQTLQLEGVAAVVWDATGDQWSECAAVAEEFPTAPLMALIDFPRSDEIRRTLDAGAAAVLSTPFHIEDVQHTLTTMLSREVDASEPSGAASPRPAA